MEQIITTKNKQKAWGEKHLTSVVDIVNNVEVVLHRGAVSAAEAGGEEEEQSQSRRQPAARQDAVPDISHSPRQHAVESLKALQRIMGLQSVKYHSLLEVTPSRTEANP